MIGPWPIVFIDGRNVATTSLKLQTETRASRYEKGHITIQEDDDLTKRCT